MDGYNEDLFTWSREQATALRELARTRPDLPNTLDLENIAEEIESLGKSELSKIESWTAKLFEHGIKLVSSTQSDPAPRWRREILAWQGSVRKHFTPGMRQNVDMQEAWDMGRKLAEVDLESYGEDMLALPAECPIPLDMLLQKNFEVDTLVDALLDAAAQTPS